MLTSKQRAYLRGLANTLEPVLQVGKDGVGENLIAQADGVLEKRELIKGNVLENSPLSAREAAQAIAGATHCPGRGAGAGAGGRLFGSVTAKEIAEEMAKQHGVTIDKRKIELPRSKKK